MDAAVTSCTILDYFVLHVCIPPPPLTIIEWHAPISQLPPLQLCPLPPI